MLNAREYEITSMILNEILGEKRSMLVVTAKRSFCEYRHINGNLIIVQTIDE
jgi:hypothetical protein